MDGDLKGYVIGTSKEENIEEIVNVAEETASEEDIPDETVSDENETVEEIVDSSVWDIGDFLTEQEKQVLKDNFGDIPLKNVKSELFKGRIIKEYEFGGYSAEYSYDASLSDDVLEVYIEKDKIKFLKDIANSLLKEESEHENLPDSGDNYLT